MILNPVNLTTGPVNITPAVRKALGEAPISHRSQEFKELYNNTTAMLCSAMGVKQTYLLSGSGTLANEAMIQEIKYYGGKGLVLSNGEFGRRLIDQVRRNALDFLSYELPWGESFNMTEVEHLLVTHSIRWILFCHCETSTGTINELGSLLALCERHNCLCFVDCMSTVGTRPLDLSRVAMATGSSGKGLASVPGLALVFSNRELVPKQHVPVYIDLSHYSLKEGIPFTISSNLVKALYVSLKQKLDDNQQQLTRNYGNQFFTVLNERGWLRHSSCSSSVYTIDMSNTARQFFMKQMNEHRLLVSHESDYLKSRNWVQLATFGFYSEAELEHVLTTLRRFELAN